MMMNRDIWDHFETHRCLHLYIKAGGDTISFRQITLRRFLSSAEDHSSFVTSPHWYFFRFVSFSTSCIYIINPTLRTQHSSTWWWCWFWRQGWWLFIGTVTITIIIMIAMMMRMVLWRHWWYLNVDHDDDNDDDELKKFLGVRIAQAGGCHFPSFANQRPQASNNMMMRTRMMVMVTMMIMISSLSNCEQHDLR